MFKGSLINDLVLHVTLGQLHLHQQRGVIVAAAVALLLLLQRLRLPVRQRPGWLR